MNDDERAVAALYDEMAADYVERIGPRQEYWDAVVAALGEVRARTVLDIGCGPGQLTAALPPDVAVFGIDLAPAMIAAARAARPAGTYVVRSYADPLPAEWPAFDTIVLASCLEFCADLAPLFRRLRDVLAVGGRIIATVAEHPHERHHVVTIPGGAAPIGVHQHSFIAVAEAAAAAGLAPRAYRHMVGWVSDDGPLIYFGLWTLVASGR